MPIQSTMTTDMITLTVTLDDLAIWESNGLAAYATPAEDDPHYAIQVYVASQPQFMYDFCIATVEDFANATGLDLFGFAEWTEEEWAACKDDVQTLTIPRHRQNHEAYTNGS